MRVTHAKFGTFEPETFHIARNDDEAHRCLAAGLVQVPAPESFADVLKIFGTPAQAAAQEAQIKARSMTLGEAVAEIHAAAAAPFTGVSG